MPLHYEIESTTKLLANRMLTYYRISSCLDPCAASTCEWEPSTLAQPPHVRGMTCAASSWAQAVSMTLQAPQLTDREFPLGGIHALPDVWFMVGSSMNHARVGCPILRAPFGLRLSHVWM